MTRVRLVVAVVLAGLALALVPALPAAALVDSKITWVTESPVQTAYGGNWSLRLLVRIADFGAVPIPGSQATVDVRANGVEQPIATGLPIQPDGSVYVSAPVAALPPGTYQLTATVVPVKGGYVLASKTSTPLVLEVSSYAIAASTSVDVTGAVPVVDLALSGEYVDSTGTVPAGQWHVTVGQGSFSVLDSEVAQPAGEPDPVRVPVTGELAAGATYSVRAEFTPVESVAAGLEITQPDPQTFSTPAQTLASEVPYPLWLMILTALVPLGLAAAVIALTVRLSRRGRSPASVDVMATPADVPATPVAAVAAEPTWDPFATVASAQPVQAAPPVQPAPAQVLPPGEFTQLITPVTPEPTPAPEPTQNWSLSQDEPDEPESPVLR